MSLYGPLNGPDVLDVQMYVFMCLCMVGVDVYTACVCMWKVVVLKAVVGGGLYVVGCQPCDVCVVWCV